MGFMAMEPLFRSRLFGAWIRWLGSFPVMIDRFDMGAWRTAVSRLRAGQWLVIFPEARRSLDGRLLDLQDGVALLALHTGAPIVPVRIEGAHRAWPKNRLLPRPFRRIQVHYGQPIHPPVGVTHQADRAQAVAEMMTKLRRALEGDPEVVSSDEGGKNRNG